MWKAAWSLVVSSINEASFKHAPWKTCGESVLTHLSDQMFAATCSPSCRACVNGADHSYWLLTGTGWLHLTVSFVEFSVIFILQRVLTPSFSWNNTLQMSPSVFNGWRAGPRASSEAPSSFCAALLWPVNRWVSTYCTRARGPALTTRHAFVMPDASSSIKGLSS